MGTTAQYPSPTNPFIPNSSNSQMTSNLVINYSRDPSKFLLNSYIKLIPVNQRLGYYVRLSVGQGWRFNQLGSANLANNYLWNPAQGRPLGDANKQGFLFVPYNTDRYSFTTNYDWITTDQASYELEASLYAMLAQQAMTWRTIAMLSTATTSGNWPASNTSSASSLVGGTWTNATSSDPYIQKSIQKMSIQIKLDTGGVVQTKDLSVLINPNLAAAASQSDEWRTYLAQQQGAPSFLQGENPTPAELYNLAQKMYGIKLLVEDTVYNTSDYTPADNVASSLFVMPDADALVISRPGDLPGSQGSTDFATLGIFSYEEMTSETESESWHRRTKYAVTEDFQCQIITPLAGYLLTSAI